MLASFDTKASTEICTVSVQLVEKRHATGPSAPHRIEILTSFNQSYATVIT